MINLILNAQSRLRSGWWIVLFFIVMAAMLLPVLIAAHDDGTKPPLLLQAMILLVASLFCQLLRRRPVDELVGALDGRWPVELAQGVIIGALLMALPALFLGLTGAVSWQSNLQGSHTIGPILLDFAIAAAVEELLFRGFLFQRFIDGIGTWPAQIVIAALFLLTHMDALQGSGTLGYLAGANIFLASIMFGLAFVKTRSLAMPLGIHFAANAMQGAVLGFGVSGGDYGGLLSPQFHDAPDWLTGGSFGLEASVPGFVAVVLLTAILARWRGRGA